MFFHSLRDRLIISHIFPLLIVIPLAALALIYILETQVLLPQLTQTVVGNAELIAEFSSGQTQVWMDPAAAQEWLNQINPELPSQVMFLTPDGRLLASNRQSDSGLVNTVLDLPELAGARNGQVMVRQDYYRFNLNSIAVDVFVPVRLHDQQVQGIVRLSYSYETGVSEFLRFRYLIAGISFIGVISGVILGVLLALNISYPIQQVTETVGRIARGKLNEQLLEQGPEEVKLLLRAVNHLAERLHTIEESRRMMLANLIHELGRPLGALRSANQAILEGAYKDPKILRQLLLGMDDEMDRLQYLLEQLQHLQDQILGTLGLNPQEISLKEWLSRLLLIWKEAALDKQLDWETSVPSSLPHIHADPVLLEQALGNLISNAIKYTPAGGKISITAHASDNQVWFTVKDTGPGIAPEEIRNLFKPFYRGNREGQISQGMGLGLSLARDRIVAHGGSLTVESSPGVGSSFTITLPLNRKPGDPGQKNQTIGT